MSFDIEIFNKIIETVSKFISELGFPILVGVCGIVLMMGFVYVIYLAGKWIGLNFLKPLFPRIFNILDKHSLLVESAGKCLESIDESLKQMVTTNTSNDKKLDSIQAVVDKSNEMMAKFYEESHRNGRL